MQSICLRDLEELTPTSSLGVEWDLLVANNPASGFMQSTHWATFKRRMGFTVHHLGLFEGEQLVGGAILYAAPNCKGAGFLAAPDGPVLPWNNDADAERCQYALQLLLEGIQAEAQQLGAMALRIAPRLTEPQSALLADFAKAPVSLTEHKTMYLDLTQGPEQLLQAMKPKARYNIGLATRKGVMVREESTSSAAKNFYSVMQSVGGRDHFAVEPLSFFITLIDTLCSNGLARVFFAEHEEDILGALLTITFGGRSSYLYGGTTDLKRNYMGGYALQWAAIKAAQDQGASIYDFWGFDATESPDNSYAGFSRFKSQFSGKSISLIGTFDYYFMGNLADLVVRALKETEPIR